MEAKQLRQAIMEVLYSERTEFAMSLSDFRTALSQRDILADDKTLHGEITYLKGKYLLEVLNPHNGQYLNFLFLRITSDGIDLVEDPDAFGRLFAVNVHTFGNVAGSNITIGSSHTSQNIQNLGLSEKEKGMLLQIKEAIDENNEKKAFSLLTELGDGAKNVFWNIVATAITTMTQ